MASPAIRQNSTLSTLSPVQVQVVIALAAGISVTSAAETAGIHRSTIYTWLNTDPYFRVAVEQSRTEYDHRLQDELRSLGQIALKAIRELLESTATPAAVRLRAALAILRHPLSLPHPSDAILQSAEADTSFLRARGPSPAPQKPAEGVRSRNVPAPAAAPSSTSVAAPSLPFPPIRQNSTLSTSVGGLADSAHVIAQVTDEPVLGQW